MTNTGGTPAGWYHASGDPEGTHRYWDGAQWIGDPQAADRSRATDAPAAPTPPPTGGQPPTYGAPPVGGQQPPSYGSAPGGQPPQFGAPPAVGGPPPGYQAFGSGAAAVAPAEFGDRAIAYLIDIAPIIGVAIVIQILGFASDALGILASIVGNLAIIGYSVWNFYIVQGRTGQTIGKEKQGIKLVSDDTGQPVGGGMAFVRYLVSGAFILLCCIGWVVNLLAPLWNADKKTYSDKIMKMSVLKSS